MNRGERRGDSDTLDQIGRRQGALIAVHCQTVPRAGSRGNLTARRRPRCVDPTDCAHRAIEPKNPQLIALGSRHDDEALSCANEESGRKDWGPFSRPWVTWQMNASHMWHWKGDERNRLVVPAHLSTSQTSCDRLPDREQSIAYSRVRHSWAVVFAPRRLVQEFVAESGPAQQRALPSVHN